ncbi:MAG: hypothetical protein JNM46_06220 [Anaerolineales bacterium]|nr:hypothetical protein [Anaerolineales bacterium]
MTFLVYGLVAVIVAGIIGIFVSGIYSIYQRNLKKLNTSIESQIVKPSKIRFVLSWIVFSLILLSPGILTIWLIGKEFPFNFTWILLLISLSLAPAAYPYYNIVVSNNRINGATKWGLAWERVEIKFEDIDIARLSRPQLGKIFGITVIHSKGSEILTLGLSNQQLAEIVNLK